MNETIRNRAAKAAKALRKVLGESSVMLLGASNQTQVAVIPTGSMGLNRALGVGGIPRGRIVEIYGPEASGKTTLTLSLIAQAQADNGLAAFVDAEHALDPAYARRIGVDVDSLLLCQPDSGEEGLEVVEQLIRHGGVDLIVVDSVAALVPQAEIDGDMGDRHVGLQARLMSQALRKLAPVAFKSNTTLVFVNQIRMKIGNAYGSPETTTGGRALRFYASVRLDIRRIASLKGPSGVYGSRVRVKVAKNKVSAPHTQTEFDVIFGDGIDGLGELLDLGIEAKVCCKAGAWYTFADVRLGQGRLRAISYLRDNPDVAQTLEAAIRRSWAVADGAITTHPENEKAAA